MKSFLILFISIIFFVACNPKEPKPASDLDPSEKETALISFSIVNAPSIFHLVSGPLLTGRPVMRKENLLRVAFEFPRLLPISHHQ